MLPNMRQFIQSLQKSRGLSVADMAALLGYKSQTSVARVMQGRANIDSVTKFCQQLKDNEQIALTDEEASQLDRILEYTKLGDEGYATTDVLRQLLREDPPMVDPVLVDAYTGERQTLLERYLPMQDLRITVLNCESFPLFGALAKLAVQNNVQVEHYLYSDHNLLRTVLTVRSVLPILHLKNYYGAISFCSREQLLTSPRGILLSDVMFTEYMRNGSQVFDLIILQPTGEGLSFTFPSDSSSIQRMVCSLKENAVPIRNPGTTDYASDYVAYINYCSELEKDRAVYRIKPDFGMEQIPLRIWQRALMESPLGEKASLTENMVALFNAFSDRQANSLSKKQAQHHVLKQRAVWKFVRTGRLSDQFWGFRTLNMAERLETLQFIMEQYNTNPYYHIHFLKDDDAMRDDEFVCYDGLGLSIIKAGTDYNLSTGHSETQVVQPEFLKIYRNFFLHSILPFNVQPEYRTRKILLEMIKYCQSHIQE